MFILFQRNREKGKYKYTFDLVMTRDYPAPYVDIMDNFLATHQDYIIGICILDKDYTP